MLYTNTAYFRGRTYYKQDKEIVTEAM